MRVGVAAIVLVFTTACLAQTPSATQKLLDKNQIMTLVTAGMESEELAKRIRERGIDFELTDDYLQALRKAGAQDVVIQALRAASSLARQTGQDVVIRSLRAARPTPLTRDQILKLVAGGVPSQRVAMLVKEYGIDFLPDEKYLETLHVAGADETLIAAVRAAGEAITAEVTVVTSPNAEVYLDGTLQGRANPQGELIINSKLGVHSARISHNGKKDHQTEITLVAGKANKLEARLEDIDPEPGESRINPKDGLKYVWIPAGTFMMGCSPGDSECGGDEIPPRQVTISKDHWMGQTEVTVGAYKRFAAATGRAMPPQPEVMGRPLNSGWSNESFPIVMVSWDDAKAYCAWAGGRLPTEAEWEYAGRAGTTAARYGALDEIAWHADNSGNGRIDSARIWREDRLKYVERLRDNGNGMHKVGQKRANGFGLFDMLGNASEWAGDWYSVNYYQNSLAGDPQGARSGELRVQRGGSWGAYPGLLRASDRNSYAPASVGFRCVREVAP